MAPRRLPYHQQEEVQNDITEKVQSRIIKNSSSPWAFPIAVVRTKHVCALIQICVDYRRLNNITRKVAHFLPCINNIFDALKGSKYCLTFDLANGYHQVAVRKQGQKKTAFVTTCGYYEYEVRPFGLCNAPDTFQRFMALIISGHVGLECLIYQVDIIIFCPTFDVDLFCFEKVCIQLQENHLKLKLQKCYFGISHVSFVGHVVSGDGIHSPYNDIVYSCITVTSKHFTTSKLSRTGILLPLVN